jgi:hypothetical protein
VFGTTLDQSQKLCVNWKKIEFYIPNSSYVHFLHRPKNEPKNARLIFIFLKSTDFPPPQRPDRFHLGEMLFGRLPLAKVKTP